MTRSKKCGLCQKTTRTHRRANDPSRKKQGQSDLKVLKPRSARIRRSDVEVDHD